MKAYKPTGLAVADSKRAHINCDCKVRTASPCDECKEGAQAQRTIKRALRKGINLNNVNNESLPALLEILNKVK